MKVSFASAIILILILILGCEGNNETEKNVTTITAMFDAFNQHDWQKMVTYYSEDAKFLDPSYGIEYVTKTRSEVAAKYAELEKIFPDIHDHVLGTYSSGDKITVEFISTGTISDSVHLKLPIVTIFTLKDGLITKDATYYDLENP